MERALIHVSLLVLYYSNVLGEGLHCSARDLGLDGAVADRGFRTATHQIVLPPVRAVGVGPLLAHLPQRPSPEGHL